MVFLVTLLGGILIGYAGTTTEHYQQCLKTEVVKSKCEKFKIADAKKTPIVKNFYRD